MFSVNVKFIDSVTFRASVKFRVNVIYKTTVRLGAYNSARIRLVLVLGYLKFIFSIRIVLLGYTMFGLGSGLGLRIIVTYTVEVESFQL